MECQVGGLPQAGRPLGRIDVLIRRILQAWGGLKRVCERVTAGGGASCGDRHAAGSGQEGPRRAPLGLKPGERVRVRSWAEIEQTLDADKCCGGLGWLPLQQHHCGKTYAVVRRVDRFFDERARRLLKLRDVVLLDGVHCIPPKDGPWSYAGCERMCFLFWKEDWLERVSAEGGPEQERP